MTQRKKKKVKYESRHAHSGGLTQQVWKSGEVGKKGTTSNAPANPYPQVRVLLFSSCLALQLGGQIGNTCPCGFFGCSGRPECQVFMQMNSKKNIIQTKCPCVSNFQYKMANKVSGKGACRNVPIVCGLKNDFVPAVWRYNMPEH
ncbi:hypothetical protein K438DRAFT_1811262 [Mycena galopus ATCC 62051]|nr:hypothetical protein K438DRAFT_1811262 [Mycena galopus ATCC 62051]